MEPTCASTALCETSKIGRPIDGDRIQLLRGDGAAGAKPDRASHDRRRIPDHLALVHHKVGFVAAGEASILIRVQTAHSAEGFDLCREYLRRIKETVPIWKRTDLFRLDRRQG